MMQKTVYEEVNPKLSRDWRLLGARIVRTAMIATALDLCGRTSDHNFRKIEQKEDKTGQTR